VIRKYEVSAQGVKQADTDALVVGVYRGEEVELAPGATELFTEAGGVLVQQLQALNFKGEKGETLLLPAATLGNDLRCRQIVVVGLGEREKVNLEVLRQASAAGVRAAKGVRSIGTTLWAAADQGQGNASEAIRAVVEGAGLGSYRFTKYKTRRDEEKSALELERLVLLGCAIEGAAEAVEQGRAVVEAVAWARDMVNEPASGKAPLELAHQIKEKLVSSGVSCEIWDVDRIEREGLGGVLGVGKGSINPPCLLRAHYSPGNASGGGSRRVCLVGKGVVFDSGGLSLKPAEGMETMKTDMSGGAAVAATMWALPRLKINAEVFGFLPLVENLPSGSAIKPGDVLKFRNGKTAEVLNTDAEGRLIMADALALSCELRPDCVIDLATLTGACMVALGTKIFGVMGNDQGLVSRILEAAKKAGERAWQLPLPDDYKKQLESEVADVKNIGSRYGGALTAGLFLAEFVSEGIPWAHLDIAGPARAESDEYEVSKGGTGVGVRTLLEFLKDPTFGGPSGLPDEA
jgi:leucyl aminopeptidase